MATFLYRLGRFSFRRRRLVLMLWIAVLAAVGIGAAGVSSSTSDTFAIPGTQSQKALDLLEKEFPQASADGATARVVFEAPAGQKLTSAAHKAEVESLVGDLKSASQVASVADPYTGGTVSKDGSVAYAQVTYKVAQADVTDAARADLEHVAEQGERAGLAVEHRRHGRQRGVPPERGRADRHRGRRPGHGHHLRLAGRGRTAAADRALRRRRGDLRDHRGDLVHRPQLQHHARWR